MLAREAILNDPEVVEMLTKHFVCFAIDNANNSNTTKMEREFLKPLGGTASTQGMSTFTAGGQHRRRVLPNSSAAPPAPERRDNPDHNEEQDVGRRPVENELRLYHAYGYVDHRGNEIRP